MDSVYIAYLDYVFGHYIPSVMDAVASFLWSPGVFPFVAFAMLVLVINVVFRLANR